MQQWGFSTAAHPSLSLLYRVNVTARNSSISDPGHSFIRNKDEMATDADSSQPLLASNSNGLDYGSSDTNKVQETRLQDGSVVGVVHFPPGDPEDPRNWPRWKKWLMIGPILIVDLSVSWGASGFSPASGKFAEDFGLSPEAGTLGLSLYILGLAFGPMTL